MQREVHVAGNGRVLRVADVETVVARIESDPGEASGDAIRLLRFLAASSNRTVDETPDRPKVFADAELVAEKVAWRCSPGSHRDGSPKAPTRHATIWQAARLGAIEYAKLTQGDRALSATPAPFLFERKRDEIRAAEATPAPEAAVEAQYLIRKSGAYYRPNAAGYTYNVAEAGRYALDDAIRHSHPNGPDGPRDGITYELAPPPSHEVNETERLREGLVVGERFLSACNSAWAAGEPSHRVVTMLNLADEFRAALDRALADANKGGAE